MVLIAVLWAVLAPVVCLLYGYAKGIEHGEERGAEEMRRAMLRHPAVRQVKRLRRSA